jgi:hypothetical protein
VIAAGEREGRERVEIVPKIVPSPGSMGANKANSSQVLAVDIYGGY